MNKSAVIFGVSGLVGYHLAKKLLELDMPVVGIDKTESKLSEKLIELNGFSFKLADIEKEKQLKSIIPVSCNIVYHLAGQPSVWYANTHPLSDFRINSLGTINILECLRDINDIKIVYASTGDVYGDSKIASEDNQLKPDNFYGLSKLTAEKYIQLYSRIFNYKFTILRFSLIYGPEMRRNVVYDVLKGLRNNALNLYTNIHSTYDLLYIDDVIRALVMASTEKWNEQILNISSGYGVSTETIIKTIYNKMKRSTDIEVKEIETKVVNKVFANAKALEMGWNINTKFDEGIMKTLDWWNTI